MFQINSEAQVGRLMKSKVLAVSRRMAYVVMILISVVLTSVLLMLPANDVLIQWLIYLFLAFVIGAILDRLRLPQVNQFLLASGLSIFLMCSTMHSKMVNPSFIHEASYFNPRFFLIGMCFFPFLVFDLQNQRKSLFLSVGINLLLIWLYFPIHELFLVGPQHVMELAIQHEGFSAFATGVSATAVCIGMFVLKTNNRKFEKRVDELLQTTTLQNEELNAGIRYAARLQSAFMDNAQYSEQLLNHEVFQLPKDKLSGDFYIFQPYHHGYLASVVDCTGHGVPGAFVSIMARNAFQTAIQGDEFLTPDEILVKMNQKLREEFRSNKSTIQDGMDLALCFIDPLSQSIKYGSAQGIGFIVKPTGLHILDRERRSIGDSISAPFELFEVSYEVGEKLVLTSDGFKDQFGEMSGKKYGSRRFKQWLKQNQNESLTVWQKRIAATFHMWKGREEQVDDVCVICIELP